MQGQTMLVAEGNISQAYRLAQSPFQFIGQLLLVVTDIQSPHLKNPQQRQQPNAEEQQADQGATLMNRFFGHDSSWTWGFIYVQHSGKCAERQALDSRI